jgi:hypothetical protein
VQAASHVRVRPVPQLATDPGLHSPSLEHVDQLDHSPSVQVRVCSPQLPQACVVGPTHRDSTPQTAWPFTVVQMRPVGQGSPQSGEAPFGAQGENPVVHWPARFEQQTHEESVSMVNASQASPESTLPTPSELEQPSAATPPPSGNHSRATRAFMFRVAMGLPLLISLAPCSLDPSR